MVTTPIRHEPSAQRFVADVDGVTAYINYRELPNGTLDLHHTFVPPAARGAGIASQLTAHALNHARALGVSVVPTCPFVAAFIRRRPEYRDLVS
jgi:predicted GNAT family acetyltransferase